MTGCQHSLPGFSDGFLGLREERNMYKKRLTASLFAIGAAALSAIAQNDVWRYIGSPKRTGCKEYLSCREQR
jgi:hypothetical protein